MSDPDLADQLRRQAPGKLLPAVAPVAAAVDPAFAGPRDHRPGLALGSPHGGVELVRVVLVHQQLDRPGRVRHEEDVFPRLPAVAGAVDAALRVRAEGVAGSGEVRDVGVARVDADAADLAGVAKAEVAPGGAVVVGAVDAAAGRDVAADGVGAGADVEDGRVGGRHRDGADRADGDAVVGDVLPRLARALRLPDAAAGGTEVEGVRLGAYAGDGGDTTAPEGAQFTEAEGLEFGRGDLPLGRVGGVEGGLRRGLRGGRAGEVAEGERGPCESPGQPGYAIGHSGSAG